MGKIYSSQANRFDKKSVDSRKKLVFHYYPARLSKWTVKWAKYYSQNTFTIATLQTKENLNLGKKWRWGKMLYYICAPNLCNKKRKAFIKQIPEKEMKKRNALSGIIRIEKMMRCVTMNRLHKRWKRHPLVKKVYSTGISNDTIRITRSSRFDSGAGHKLSFHQLWPPQTHFYLDREGIGSYRRIMNNDHCDNNNNNCDRNSHKYSPTTFQTHVFISFFPQRKK